MANPQKENGHTSIANEIIEALARINLTSYESRIIWALFRKTYGWNKKNDAISLTQFSKLTNIQPQHIARTIKQLKERNILLVIHNHQINQYQFQKNYELWDKFPDTTTSLGTTNSGTTSLGTTNSGTTCTDSQVLPSEVLEVLPSEVLTKDMKDTIQKTTTIKENINLSKIAVCYEENIGQLTPIISEKLQSISDKFSAEWFIEAVKEAASANVRRLNYIESILASWQVNGFKNKIKGKSYKGENGKYKGNPSQKPAGAFSDLE